MPASKSLTPAPAGADHPAHNLRIGDSEDIQALLKLTPVVLPNVVTVNSLGENYPNDKRWTTFRSDFRYIYVNNWMYQCRGYLKLASEHFDADLFEIELFDLVHPPPLDDLALLVNKAKMALLTKVHGKKIASLASFESLFRIYFGSSTPLGGPEEEDETDVDQSVYPRFDDLYIDEKYDVLYLLMAEVSLYLDFRDFIDKNKLSPDHLRTPLIYSHSVKKQGLGEDYILAFDNTALYRRQVAAPELIVPKKRKLAPQWPDEEYEPEKFDAASIKYELVFRDVYGLNELVKELLHNKKNKKNKALLDVLKLPDFVANVFSYEIRKRKILSHRRKDLEMARLLATRKRSSRIEAKEKQRHLEEQERKAREYEELQYAASRRRSQRARLQMQTKIKMDYTAGLSREERFNLRMQKNLEERMRESTPVVSESEVAVKGEETEEEQKTEETPVTEQAASLTGSPQNGEKTSQNDGTAGAYQSSPYVTTQVPQPLPNPRNPAQSHHVQSYPAQNLPGSISESQFATFGGQNELVATMPNCTAPTPAFPMNFPNSGQVAPPSAAPPYIATTQPSFPVTQPAFQQFPETYENSGVPENGTNTEGLGEN